MERDEADGRLIGELLRVPYHAVVRYVHHAFAEAGFPELRPAHMSILQHIDHPPRGTRITDLAERAQMTKQSMGQLVSDMEALGLVERIPDPLDRRARIIRLTDRGWEMHETAGDIGKRLEAEWTARLAPGQFAALRVLLKQLIGALEIRDGHEDPPEPLEEIARARQTCF
ncbi:MAG: MarR family winged helix-turn-helix transcriptional regulator [Thermomicrobiales bacterium]